MDILGASLLAWIGFIVASYSVIANDAIQTLGTFLASNAKRPWWVLWLFAAGILVILLYYGFQTNDTDIGFDRLNRLPYPEGGIQWYHVLPPVVLLFLTRFGIPVSTTFLVLTVFALTGGAETEGVMGKMLIKSGMGYLVAAATGLVVYALISRSWERWIGNTKDSEISPMWTYAQWGSTTFLWSQWLMQDFANIFVFLPRTTTVVDGVTQTGFNGTMVAVAGLIMVLMIAYVFKSKGGKIQEIVLSKTNTTDVRAGTLVDLLFAFMLYFFKELNDIPMSTTWVFLGLIAGREMAITFVGNLRDKREAIRDVLMDAGRLFFGLVVSVGLAVGVPALAMM